MQHRPKISQTINIKRTECQIHVKNEQYCKNTKTIHKIKDSRKTTLRCRQMSPRHGVWPDQQTRPDNEYYICLRLTGFQDDRFLRVPWVKHWCDYTATLYNRLTQGKVSDTSQRAIGWSKILQLLYTCNGLLELLRCSECWRRTSHWNFVPFAHFYRVFTLTVTSLLLRRLGNKLRNYVLTELYLIPTQWDELLRRTSLPSVCPSQ